MFSHIDFSNNCVFLQSSKIALINFNVALRGPSRPWPQMIISDKTVLGAECSSFMIKRGMI